MSAKGKEHLRLSQKQEEQSFSSRSSQLRQSPVEQLERSSVDLTSQVHHDVSTVRKERKKEHVQDNHFKYLIIAGLVVAVIILIFVPMNQKLESIEAHLEKSMQQKAAIQKDSQIIVDKSQEKSKEAKDNFLEVDDLPPNGQQKWVHDPTSNFFEIPKFVWTYDSADVQKHSFFVKKCMENIKHYSNLSNFQLITLNESNYHNFVNIDILPTINKVIQVLKDRVVKQPNSSLALHFETIKKRLIVFHVINQNGGIFIENNVFFAETFEWLKDIERNIYVNKGSPNVKAKYFGFFEVDHAPYIHKVNKTGVSAEAEKYMVQTPTVEPYFLAAQPHQEFLSEVLVEYVQILLKPSLFRQKFDKYYLGLQVLTGKNMYFQIFYTCQMIVLSRKQEQINRSGNNPFGNKFSIDYYGLLTMNDRYFPKKIGFYFQKHMKDRFYYNLARYSLPHLETVTGPIRYIVHLIEQDNLEIQLLNARIGVEKNFIHPESLIGKLLINNNSQPYILREYVREVARQKKTWDNLPRKIWQYWNSGLKNSSVANKLCFDNLRRTSMQFNFTVYELNDSNTEQYIGKELNDKINNWIKNAKITVVGPTRSDFIRLAIIAKQGGIYMDLSQFSVNGIEWVLNIAQAPIYSITNRYGDMPKVVGSYWPHYDISFNQTYDKRANTYRQMVNDYQNHFIVAEPNQELLLDWLEQYGRFISSPYSETEQIIKDLGLFGDHWTRNGNMYLAAMESLRIVVTRKSKILQKKIDETPNYDGPISGAEYYGLWSINSYSQLQRFRSHSNFDHTFNGRTNDYNIYLWRYSHEYIEGIIGKVRTFTKLYNWNIKELNNYLNKDFDRNFTDLHPQSLVAKYVYIPKFHKLTKVNNVLQLELLNP